MRGDRCWASSRVRSCCRQRYVRPVRSVLGRRGTARHLANLALEVLRVREGAEGAGAPAPDLGEGSEGGGELRLQQRRALGSGSGGFGFGLGLGLGLGFGLGL